MTMNNKTWSYLALGDSYTIGEVVPLYASFPYQLVQLLRGNDYTVAAPEIVARTGWTTDELIQFIASPKFLPPYDIVTLLIGVNNQYRGLSIEDYSSSFEKLLQTAIEMCATKEKGVFVLSIPDWGVTPFAAGRDTKQISREIDAYNDINRSITAKYHAQYIEITEGTREAANDSSLLADDKLHPSGKEYGRWAEKVLEAIKKM